MTDATNDPQDDQEPTENLAPNAPLPAPELADEKNPKGDVPPGGLPD